MGRKNVEDPLQNARCQVASPCRVFSCCGGSSLDVAILPLLELSFLTLCWSWEEATIDASDEKCQRNEENCRVSDDRDDWSGRLGAEFKNTCDFGLQGNTEISENLV